MFHDFRHPDAPEEINSELCIVGGGAAGITLALALADRGIDVCLLESGGLLEDPRTQALYEGEQAGLENANPLGCRLRYFGGTTNRWQGWCGELGVQDFAAREWVAHSGWPIDRGAIESYYPRAAALCELGPTTSIDEPLLASFDPSKLTQRIWRFSPPTRFGSVYQDPIESSPNVSVWLNCNVVAITTDPRANTVAALDLATLDGKRGRVRAGAFVLACGGMENTRLLLLGNGTTSFGNRSGALGRFFTQHIEAVAARVTGSDLSALAEAFELRRGDGIRAHVAISPELQAQRQLLSTAFTFGDPGRDYSPGYRASREIFHALAAGRWPDDLSQKISTVAGDLDGLAEDVFVTRRQVPQQLNLNVYSEQSPNADSRLTLSARRDAFGVPLLCIDWRLTPRDRHSIASATLVVAEELGRLQLGRVQLADWLADESAPWPQPLWSGCHHMGTTRMSAHPDDGVVDADCRVHGLDNLYVASSSVFPTGGYVPPTLSIIALALRLSDHLVQRYG
jgi:choline dehydrogenase-like flavoprotein